MIGRCAAAQLLQITAHECRRQTKEAPMTIALGFLLPLLLYIALYVWLRRKRPGSVGRAATLAAAGVALITSAFILGVAFLSPQWPEGTQIAWTAVEASSKPLVIGGAREEAVVGWPNGSFTPQLKITANEPAQAAIEISGGNAFVYDEDAKTYLNGDVLATGEPKKIGDYTFRVIKGRTLLTLSLLVFLPLAVFIAVFVLSRKKQSPPPPRLALLLAAGAALVIPLILVAVVFLSPRWPDSLLPAWTQKVEISKDGADVPAVFYLPNAFIGKARVYTLDSQIERSETLAASQSEEIMRLKQWATGVRLLLSGDGTIHVLERDKVWPNSRPLPCKVQVIWPGLNLPAEIRKDGVKLVMDFPPPWRLVSPIPPSPNEVAATAQANDAPSLTPTAYAQSANRNSNAVPETEELPLVVTSRARPDDIAFVLPFGQGINDPREMLTLVKQSGYETIFAPSKSLRSKDSARDNVPPEYRQAPKVGNAAGVTSKATIRSGPYAFTLATVHDLPRPQAIVGLLAVALLCFFGGLLLARARMEADELWAVCGIAATVWSFLGLRLLLAIRYALAPNYLDQLAVSGVATAFIGLALVPGLLLLACRLRCDYFARPDDAQARKRIMTSALIYLLMLAAALIFEHTQSAHLWANLPDKLVPAISLPFKVALAALMIYLALAIRLIYQKAVGEKRPRELEYLLLGPWCFSAGWLSRKVTAWWEKMADGQPLNRARVAALMVIAFFYFALLPVGLSLIPARKFFQEILAPILFCWPPAIFWLSSKRYFTPGGSARRPTRAALMVCALLTIVPVLFLPMFIHDAGSLMTVLAIFIPLTLVLLSAAPRYCGWVTALTLTVAFLAAAVVYLNLRTFFPYLPGEAGVRLLNFKEESAVQNYILFANAVKGENSGGLPLQKLRNGYQHTWENNAIAHAGGFLGLGYGNAPTRRSQVRQDTIQFDSVFSFFVVSEHGLTGGIALLLLYGVPLAIILFSGRWGFDFGSGLAALIAGAFLFEGIFHAGMNLNAFPFTGRDLPLLAVNSLTDLLRWTILFGAMAMAVFWKYDDGSEIETDDSSHIKEDAISIITPNAGPASGNIESPPLYRRAVIWITLIPALALAYVAWHGWRVARDVKLDEPFGWDVVLKTTAQVIQEGGVTVDQQTKKLRLDPTKIKVSEGMLIEQEVKRFNALPESERDEETRTRTIIEQMNRVGSFADYTKTMDAARRLSLFPAQERHPSLFRLTHPQHWDDENNGETRGPYGVEPNPDFNVQLSFSTGRKRADIPRVTLRNNQETIVGPAWVMGHWTLATNTDAPLPWTTNLAAAMAAETSRLGANEVAARYGTLTLDQALQRAALNFAAEKGRALYDGLLKRLPAVMGNDANGQAPTIDERRRPPRVALAILSLPSGETLALGGWPRMTADHFWRYEDQREWLPPADWVQGEAPRTLRFLYEGDRNFDRIVMGSTTKPIWATAVLGVHPRLDQRLHVAGSDGEESDIFGIRLARSWHVTPSNWRGFNDYLSLSDNRYQVRLGFLGLAEKNGDTVMTDGSSSSVKESLSDGAAIAWRTYPRFPEEIRFSKNQPNLMASLHETRLAEQLERMYAIGVVRNEMTHRLSFWTKREEDDLVNPSQVGGSNPDRATKLFRWISPQSPDFALDTITNPSDYVTLLLGGGTNLWANVDFAAAFGTCVTGNPVIAHVVRNDRRIEPFANRLRFTEIAAKVQPGLTGVVSQGTARGALESTGAMSLLNSLRAMGIEVYAKTGTLKASEDARDTSRIVLALIKWQDKAKGIAQTGLVFSLVGEQAQKGTAARWLGEFLVKYQNDIRRLLTEAKPGQSNPAPTAGKRR
jgi:cell division protein FtsW (lipid II flippase)